MSTENFTLTRDGEKARIRFLYDSLDEVESEDAPEELKFLQKVIRIPIYNMDKGCEQVWVRSVLTYVRLERLYKKYDEVPNKIFEITRYANYGDIHSRYEIRYIGDIKE